MADDARPGPSPFPLALDALAVFLPGLYVIGFIAVNVQQLRYGSPPPTLLSPRYLSAALLFLAMTLPAALLGSTVTWDDSDIKAAKTPADLRKITFRVMLTLLAASALPALLSITLNATAAVPFRWDTPAAAFLLGWLVAKAAKHRIPLLRRLWAMRSRTKAHAAFSRALLGPEIFYSAIYVLLLAGLYGAKVYPVMSPAYGGGAPWLVQVSLSPESPLYPTVAGALIDQSETMLLLAVCSDSLPRTVHGVTIPTARVEAIHFQRLQVVLTANELCATTPADH